MNALYYGDNLDVLRKHVKDETVDLIYLDPPFSSNQNYNVLFKQRDGSKAASQVRAFEDTWQWDEAAVLAYQRVVEGGGRVAQSLSALSALVPKSDMLAYLSMMAPRLVELHRVLKPTGSLYLHCDSNASHYLKLLLDAVFGPNRFLNEIIWKRTTAHNSAKRYGPVHDTILYYSKTERRVWNSPRKEYEQEYLDKYYRFDDGDGRLYWRADLTGPGVRNGSSGLPWKGINPGDIGRHWIVPVETLDVWEQEGRIYWPPGGKMPQHKRYREDLKGVAVSDVWDDIDRINPVGGERLGYQTQKPLAILERIVTASSNPGGVVLDPFCGCGTAIEAAQKLKRQWVGIDITQVAIGVISRRMERQCGLKPKKDYKVAGEPISLPDAQALALQDRFEFQVWAVNTLAGHPVEQKKGADKGIDGKLYFHDDSEGGPTKTVIISVKSGSVGVKEVRELCHVVNTSKAAIGVMVLLEDPTKPMRTEAAEQGYYHSPGWPTQKYPKIQLITVEGMIHGGDRIQMPPTSQANVTFGLPVGATKPAPKKKGKPKPGPSLYD